ncbi:MAG: Fe-S metabolism protein SufE [Candidatus Puniceispirillum sp. TMED52]|nr:MAG: Fe-S metabolism protein SufE [Candidatus Puniceispirillum sp. TMED52]
MGLADAAQDIVDEFDFLDDWEERYQHLIGMGRALTPLDTAIMTDDNRLRGCQSVVHFKADYSDGLMHYQAGSDAAIVQGLIALLMRVYSGQRPDDILEFQPQFLQQIGLDEHLSPTRKNGLASMITAIMAEAKARTAI